MARSIRVARGCAPVLLWLLLWLLLCGGCSGALSSGLDGGGGDGARPADTLPTDGGGEVPDATVADGRAVDGSGPEAAVVDGATASDGGEPDAAAADSGPPGPGRHVPFTVMTQNVRHVTSIDTGYYDWSKRSAYVRGRVKARAPDIFGLQESSSPVIQNDFKGDAFIAATYDHYQPPGGSPKMIFWRTSRFHLASGSDVTGNHYLPNPYAALDCGVSANANTCYCHCTSRTAAFATLVDQLSGRRYLIVNTHMGHNSGQSCELHRQQSAQYIHEKIIAPRGPQISVVLFGDLNMDPQASNGAFSGDKTLEMLEGGAGVTGDVKLWRGFRNAYGVTGSGDASFNHQWKHPGAALTVFSHIDWLLVGGDDVTSAAPVTDQAYTLPVGGSSVDSPSDHFGCLVTVRNAIFAAKVVTDGHGDGNDPATRMAFADVSGDGYADKISWNPGLAGGQVRVFLNDQQMGFLAAVSSPASTSASTRLLFADLDGDGCADMVRWDPTQSSGRLQLHPADCSGGFGAAQDSPLGASQSSSMRYALARIDADACADLVAWDPGASAAPKTYLAHCAATTAFSFKAGLSSPDDGASANSDAQMYYADVDGDGLADKIVWDVAQWGGRTRVYRSQGDGTFTLWNEHKSGWSGNVETQYYFADVDNDGRADKIFWRYDFRDGRPQIYLATSSGFAAQPIMENRGISGVSLTRYLFADLDGNGSADRIYYRHNFDGGNTRAYLSLY